MPRKPAGPEVAALLHREVPRRWPERIIPPAEGGPFFREVASRTGLVERKISDLARRLGYWRSTPADVRRGASSATPGGR